MTAKQEEASLGEDIKNHRGVILGYWDHEKTPSLIQDLEESVDLVERKCKNLLQELMYYKKYLEESEKPEVYLAVFKKKGKKSKDNRYLSESDPDIAYRKNLINMRETQQVFEKKFQEKLVSINEDLRLAAQKLGLKDSIILFPTDDYLRKLSQQTEHRAQRSWNEVRDKFLKLNRFRAMTRSDSIIADIGNSEQYAKITKNELKLYQKLSRLTVKRGRRRLRSLGRKAIATKGKKIKFSWSSRFLKDLRGGDIERKKPDSRQSKLLLKDQKKNSGNEGDTRVTCRAPVGTAVRRKLEQEGGKEEERVDLRTIIKKSVPFTTCRSTSKSYNLGLNLQQLMSLSKRRGRSKSQMRPSGRNQENGRTMEKSCRETLMWAPGFDSEETHRVEEGGNVWVSKKRTSSSFRKIRSKYTGSSPGSFVEYHKSTMSRYTNGRKSMIKSESKSAYAVGLKIMVSDCQRTDIFEIGKDKNSNETLGDGAGDGHCNGKCAKLSSEWTQVYNAFLNTYRKYTLLKEKLSDNNFEPSNDELKSQETEIEFAIQKYKDFLRFYSKFLHLKHRLKSLKIACETNTFRPMSSVPLNPLGKVSSKRPTSSMVMKKAFMEVQALQDKIRLLSG